MTWRLYPGDSGYLEAVRPWPGPPCDADGSIVVPFLVWLASRLGL